MNNRDPRRDSRPPQTFEERTAMHFRAQILVQNALADNLPLQTIIRNILPRLSIRKLGKMIDLAKSILESKLARQEELNAY